MLIIGCDLHSRYQVIARLDTETGEISTRRLEHENGEARAFYAGLPKPVLIGIEATGYTQWFERMVAERGHELWIGDAAEIRAREPRRQKTDERDAEHLQDLLARGQFPRIGVPSVEERDLRQLLKYRNKLELLDELEPKIEKLNEAVKGEAEKRDDCRELMKVKGVGPVTALAYVLTVGPVSRFRNSRALVSYLGLNPSEHSSGGHQRLGHISKQGNQMLRWLLVEVSHTAAQHDPILRRKYQRLKFRRGGSVAQVAVARHLAVRLYWALRQASQTPPPVRTSGSPSSAVVEESPSKV